jgi:hypothetical protein
MAINLTITGSVIINGAVNNTPTKPTETHDLSPFIAGNANKTFTLNPSPEPDSLIVSLDGLILRKSPDGIAGDYTYDQATNILTLLVANLESDSVLLAMYQEA